MNFKIVSKRRFEEQNELIEEIDRIIKVEHLLESDLRKQIKNSTEDDMKSLEKKFKEILEITSNKKKNKDPLEELLSLKKHGSNKYCFSFQKKLHKLEFQLCF